MVVYTEVEYVQENIVREYVDRHCMTVILGCVRNSVLVTGYPLELKEHVHCTLPNFKTPSGPEVM